MSSHVIDSIKGDIRNEWTQELLLLFFSHIDVLMLNVLGFFLKRSQKSLVFFSLTINAHLTEEFIRRT